MHGKLSTAQIELRLCGLRAGRWLVAIDVEANRKESVFYYERL
jgi:hypothetical protein